MDYLKPQYSLASLGKFMIAIMHYISSFKHLFSSPWIGHSCHVSNVVTWTDLDDHKDIYYKEECLKASQHLHSQTQLIISYHDHWVHDFEEIIQRSSHVVIAFAINLKSPDSGISKSNVPCQ